MEHSRFRILGHRVQALPQRRLRAQALSEKSYPGTLLWSIADFVLLRRTNVRSKCSQSASLEQCTCTDFATGSRKGQSST